MRLDADRDSARAAGTTGEIQKLESILFERGVGHPTPTALAVRTSLERSAGR
jgi:hypothetical protein